jgi:hypothetical protein
VSNPPSEPLRVRVVDPATVRVAETVDARLTETADARLVETADVRVTDTANVRLTETADVRLTERADVTVHGPIDVSSPVAITASTEIPVTVTGTPRVEITSEVRVAPTPAAAAAASDDQELTRLDALAATLIQTGVGGLIAGVALGLAIDNQRQLVTAVMIASAVMGLSACLAAIATGEQTDLNFKRLLTDVSRDLLVLALLGGGFASITLHVPNPFK